MDTNKDVGDDNGNVNMEEKENYQEIINYLDNVTLSENDGKQEKAHKEKFKRPLREPSEKEKKENVWKRN